MGRCHTHDLCSGPARSSAFVLNKFVGTAADTCWHALRGARARREAVLKQAVEGATADGVYTGINNYIDYTAVRAATRADEPAASSGA